MVEMANRSSFMLVSFVFAAVLAAQFVFSSAAISPVIHRGVNKQCPLSTVCFALDQSNSIRSQYEKEVQFVKDVAAALDGRALDVKYSAVGFSDEAKTIQTATTNLNALQTSLMNFNPSFGETNLHDGLSKCLTQIQNESGIRIILLITDGRRTVGPDPVALANAINGIGPNTIIMTVGIGSGVNQNALRNIAKDARFFFPTTFPELPTKVPELVDSLCDTRPMSCKTAFNQCDFRFVGKKGLPTFSIGGVPDRAFTSRIFSKAPAENLGTLNANSIVPEFISKDGSVTPITALGSQKFTPTHFKPFKVPGTYGSGVGHQTFHGNQLSIAKGKCVRVYFTHYQTLFANTNNVMGNLNDVKRIMNKCVVFRTK